MADPEGYKREPDGKKKDLSGHKLEHPSILSQSICSEKRSFAEPFEKVL
jgi:hypothetical protein